MRATITTTADIEKLRLTKEIARRENYTIAEIFDLGMNRFIEKFSRAEGTNEEVDLQNE